MRIISYKEINELYRKAIELWGKKFQFIMITEETSELLISLSKDLRNPNYINRDNILEEITDVEIMLSQIRQYYNFNKYESSDIYFKKITRLKERVDSHG